ncbi:MAG: type IV pilin protein [Methylobacillus sp.]|nr:type IV pilin protein [Methylobacillus sp.]
MEAASAMERYFSQNQTYATASLGSATTDVYPAASPDGYYTLSLVKTATTYTLTATATGSQAGDECGNFTLNHLSVKGVSPPSGATISLSARECWKMN